MLQSDYVLSFIEISIKMLFRHGYLETEVSVIKNLTASAEESGLDFDRKILEEEIPHFFSILLGCPWTKEPGGFQIHGVARSQTLI